MRQMRIQWDIKLIFKKKFDLSEEGREGKEEWKKRIRFRPSISSILPINRVISKDKL